MAQCRYCTIRPRCPRFAPLPATRLRRPGCPFRANRPPLPWIASCTLVNFWTSPTFFPMTHRISRRTHLNRPSMTASTFWKVHLLSFYNEKVLFFFSIHSLTVPLWVCEKLSFRFIFLDAQTRNCKQGQYLQLLLWLWWANVLIKKLIVSRVNI